jgi:aldehyde dehydrogenase (NAD+)
MPVGKTYDVPVKSPDRFYLGGEWVTPSSADLIDVIQPATEDVWVRVAAARAADVSRAVAAARQAFDAGRTPSGRTTCARSGPGCGSGPRT